MNKNIQQRVNEQLTHFEQQHDVKVLFAVEGGSRAYGLESDQSDYDVRFVYVQRLEWYLQVDRFIAETRPKDTIVIKDGVFDYHGWELKKTLGLVGRSNPQFYEWLGSSLIYQKDDAAYGLLQTTALEYFYPKRTIASYQNHGWNDWVTIASYARNNRPVNFQWVSFKSMIHAIRCALMALWVQQFQTPPPTLVSRVLEYVRLEPAVRDEICRLLEEYRKGAVPVEYRTGEALLQFMHDTLKETHQQNDFKTPEFDLEPLDKYLQMQVFSFEQKRVLELTQ